MKKLEVIVETERRKKNPLRSKSMKGIMKGGFHHHLKHGFGKKAIKEEDDQKSKFRISKNTFYTTGNFEIKF